MNKKQKGQGAIEYLILVGGAILIVSIVVAIIIGLGSRGSTDVDQSFNLLSEIYDRELANLYHDPVVLTAPSINNLTPTWSYCDQTTIRIRITFDWVPQSEGTHSFHILNSSENKIPFRVGDDTSDSYTLTSTGEPQQITARFNVPILGSENPNPLDPIDNCLNKTYTLVLQTEKDGEVVKTTRAFSYPSFEPA